MTALRVPPLDAVKLFASFAVLHASVQHIAGMQSLFFRQTKVIFSRFFAVYELSLIVTAIKVTSFDPKNSGASIAIIGFDVGQLPVPESPCTISFTSASTSAKIHSL